MLDVESVKKMLNQVQHDSMTGSTMTRICHSVLDTESKEDVESSSA
jgi:hypothetical protein